MDQEDCRPSQFQFSQLNKIHNEVYNRAASSFQLHSTIRILNCGAKHNNGRSVVVPSNFQMIASAVAVNTAVR